MVPENLEAEGSDSYRGRLLAAGLERSQPGGCPSSYLLPRPTPGTVPAFLLALLPTGEKKKDVFIFHLMTAWAPSFSPLRLVSSSAHLHTIASQHPLWAQMYKGAGELKQASQHAKPTRIAVGTIHELPANCMLYLVSSSDNPIVLILHEKILKLSGTAHK